MVIKGIVEYDGTNFFGWQVQKGKRTVQGTLIESLQQILTNKQFRVIGASRTDAGVHAENQVFSLHFEEKVALEMPKLLRALNALLPGDVYVKSLELADDSFHARFKALSKIYKYRILDGKRSPLRSRYVWELPYALDAGVLESCASLLPGEHDFSFLKMTGEKVYRKVKFNSAHWERKDDEIVFIIEGGHFLYKLVRVLVGSMVYGFKKYGDEMFFRNFLEGREGKVIVAPACGLTLVAVNY
jgi:tRNA pseudouridine38-40 synthase